MTKNKTILLATGFALTAVFLGSAAAQDMLPRPDQPFRGHVGTTVEDLNS